AAANGGNCPLTIADEIVQYQGVTIVGITNFPALIPADASAFYARNLFNLIEIMFQTDSAEPQLKDLTQDDITAAMLVKPSISINPT
ncbi:MAG: NAD(P)(+) transhydrogenase (Re/Si-specific) subunit alpha, partial [Chromatium okenii]|nr:NAD(P)(+) transhydrogenase (Re/Si-specific) subunit alpha [Chromatium okenii]